MNGSLIAIGLVAFMISSPISFLHTGFSGNVDSGFRPWLLFVAENGLSVIAIQATDVLGLHISDIKAELWFARLSQVVLKLLLATGILSVFLTYNRNYRREHRFYGTVQDAYWQSIARSHIALNLGVELWREGKIEPELEPDLLHAKSFLKASKDEASAVREGVEWSNNV